jgi:hypothetical protein
MEEPLMKLRTAAVTLLTISLVACADASSGSGSTSDSPSTGPLTHPTGSDQILLRVAYEGGFIPIEYTLSSMPSVSLYGDGTLITPGAQIDIYPSPALPAIQEQHLTEEGVQAILQAALDAGLDTDQDLTDLGSVGIADASTTVFTLDANGEQHTVRVYALGELGDRPAGMSQDEFRARAELQAFVAKLGALDGFLPDGSIDPATLYEATSARLFVSEYRGDPDLHQQPVPWPLTEPLVRAGDAVAPGGYRCLPVTGADWTDTLMPAAQSANQLTPWVSDGERWSILFRPLLPDEHGC